MNEDLNQGGDTSTTGQDSRLCAALERQHASWTTGQPLSIDALASAYPLGDDGLLELIYNEIILRESAGQTPSIAEYQTRFPHLADWPRIQWDIDRALCAGLNDSSQDANGIGRYRVQAELGRGSVGVVYRAWDPQLNRVVAIKRLRSGFDAAPEELDRLNAEAEAIARMRHPYIVQIFDIGEHERQPFFAMEYCAGGSLAGRLVGQPLDARDAARLVECLASGVAEAHRHHLVHRDLKPANVLLADDSLTAPKISDFGLAKWLDVDQGLTATGALVGTPAYMAPEQALGGQRQVGPGVDVYSLGAILYECLIGRRPFEGTSIAETLEQVRSSEPVRPRQIVTGLPFDLETIALKCMQKDPRQRYETAQAVADDLARYLNGEPIRARAVSNLGRLWRWCGRNRKIAALIGSVAILLVAVAIGSTLAAVWLKRERDMARAAEERASASDRKRREELYHAYLLDARGRRLNDEVGHREQGLAAIREILKAIPPDELNPNQLQELRNEAIACLALSDSRAIAALPAWCLSTYWFDADLDSMFTTFAGLMEGRGGTSLGSLTSQSAKDLRPFDNPFPYPWRTQRTFSPNDRWLVVMRTSPVNHDRVILSTWDRQTDRWSNEREFPYGAGQLVIHPTKTEAVLPGTDGILHVIDFVSGAELRQSSRQFAASQVAFSPDGSRLAVANPMQPGEIVDYENLKVLQVVPETTHSRAVAWAKQPDSIFWGRTDGSVYRWNLGGGEGHRLPRSHSAPIADVRVSPDGQFVASMSLDDMTFVHRVSNEDLLFSMPGRLLRFSQDNRFVVESADKITIYSIVGGDVLRFDRASAQGAQFSPDGSWLATGGSNCARIMSADRLETLCVLDTDPCGQVTFHPRGNELITFGMFSHLWRWPIERVNARPDAWRIGPPVKTRLPTSESATRGFKLEPHHGGRSASWSKDGSVFAAVDYREGKILVSQADSGNLRALGDLISAASVSISADNRWVAAAAEFNPMVRVWSLKDNRLVQEWNGAHRAIFSGDGRWLGVVNPVDVQIYETGSWRLMRRIPWEPNDMVPSPIAFAPTEGVVAFSPRSGKINLFDFQANRAIATLSETEPRQYSSLAFSPDGRRLAFAGQGHDLGIWYLDQSRTQLEELGLSGEGLPQGHSANTVPASFTVDRGRDFPPPEQWARNWLMLAQWEAIQGRPVDAVLNVSQALDNLHKGASLHEKAELLSARGRYQLLNHRATAAREDWQQALTIDPDRSQTARSLARLCLLGPEEVRDPPRAFALLVSRQQDSESDVESRVLLGIALARLGRWQESLDGLQEFSDEQPLVDWFVAIDHERLGNHDQAESTLAAAAARFERQKSTLNAAQRTELEEVSREATAIVGEK